MTRFITYYVKSCYNCINAFFIWALSIYKLWSSLNVSVTYISVSLLLLIPIGHMNLINKNIFFNRAWEL